MSSLSRLRQLLRRRSVKSGDFTLASGRRSRYYIDARLTTMSGQGQVLVGEVCWQVIEEAGWKADFVGGMTLGADPVAYAIANHATRRGHRLDAFTVRKRAKGHGTGRQIEGGLPVGARVVVVDDTVTTGGSLLAAVEVVARHGAVIAGVLALVDREEGGGERVAEAGYDFRAVFTGGDLR
ncbi:MAG: orotate phosphoribosyltransferase [Gemmatimonadota bacterium]|nr:orotate phosphoribosyltransferase [Gemmatimonadota bacterium]